MVDPGRVLGLLERLRSETSHLRRLAGYEDDRLLGEPDLLPAAKYRFLVAVEACIDVGQHIISSEGLRSPGDFAGVFTVIAEGGFLPADMVPRFQAMARFRNLLVHGYARVEDEKVVAFLRENLDDLDAFAAAIAEGVE